MMNVLTHLELTILLLSFLGAGFNLGYLYVIIRYKKEIEGRGDD
jgi:hypothetical protein